MILKVYILKILLLGCISFCFSQNDSTYYYFNSTTSILEFEKKLKTLKNSIDEPFLKLVYYSRLRESDSMLHYINKLKNSKLLSGEKLSKFLYFEGFHHKITDNDSLFFKVSNDAYHHALKTKDSLTVLYSLSALSQSYDYDSDNSYNIEYLNLLEEKAKDYNNNYFKIIHLFLKGNYYLFRDKTKDATKYYKTLLKSNFTKKDSTFILYAYNSLGVLYEETIENPDSAIYYYKKKINFIRKSPTHASPESYFNTYLNIANSYLSKEKFNEAKYYYLKADSIEQIGNQLFNKSMIKENLSRLYEKTGNYKLAYFNIREYNVLSDSLNKEEHREGIANIKEQYDNEKLRADNSEKQKQILIEQAEKEKNKSIALLLGVFLLFGTILFLLIQKNTKRKQLLAEQDKALEKQKVATLLKDQEINSINAMIEGQEKERQRIANDLHDDLGGLMATVKLQFNVLKEQQTPELFNTTNSLLDEAYNKVRSIAHAKNSGVIAKQGLLKAVKNMAHNISSASTIDIEVTDYGLESRLENSLELTIFRIIQELTTNIIKHAEASQATISLTNHEDSLNIMIEDNGKGFNTNKVVHNNGMGLHSIEKRVEHLEGELKIESQPNQGTTIIIDIPL